MAEAFRLLPLEAGKPADVGLASLSGGRFALVVATKVTPGLTSVAGSIAAGAVACTAALSCSLNGSSCALASLACSAWSFPVVAAVLTSSPPHPVNRAAISGSRYLDVDMDPPWFGGQQCAPPSTRPFRVECSARVNMDA